MGLEWVVVLGVVFTDRESFRKEFRENISKGGVFVPTQERIEVRSQVELGVELAFCKAVVRLRGEVVHCVPIELASAGAVPGVALQLEATVAELLESFAPFIGDDIDLERPGGASSSPGRNQDRSTAGAPPRGRERRDSPRHTARVGARVCTDAGLPIEGRTRDLSESGMLFSIAGDPPEIGSMVFVTLANPVSGETIEIRAQVTRYVTGQADEVTAVGLRFGPSARSKQRTREFLRGLHAAEHSRSLGGITGEITELGVANLLQSFGMTTPSGTLTVLRGAEEGYVAFSDRMLVAARLGRVSGIKALVRLLSWPDGRFEFHARVDPDLHQDPPQPLEMALFEAARIFDEDRHEGTTKFSPDARFAVIERDASALGLELDKLEVAILDLFGVGANVKRVLDVIPEPDRSVYEAIENLEDRGMIEPIL